MPGETEQQYTAFLLYCEIGSLQKTLNIWNRSGEVLGESGVDLAKRLGKKPSHTTIENWSKKYHWVKRKDLKLAEDLEALREKTKKIKREKLHKIAEAFEKVANKILQQLKTKRKLTINEWKQIWEMLQVELGKPTSRFALKEEEQKPLTPEEEEEGEEIDEIIKKHHEQHPEKKSSILDTEKQNKGRKR